MWTTKYQLPFSYNAATMKLMLLTVCKS